MCHEIKKSPQGDFFYERIDLGLDFSLSRSISGKARSVLRTAKVTRTYETFNNILACINNLFKVVT